MYRQLPHRSLWSVDELSAPDAHAMLALATAIKRADGAHAALQGRHIAVLCDGDGGRSAEAVSTAATAMGAKVARIRPSASRLRDADEVRDGARYLGRFYQAIACDGLSRTQMEQLALHARVPVCNDVAAPGHPTHLLADLLTMSEAAAGKPIQDLTLCVVGETASPVADGWQRIGSLTGLGVCRCGATAQAEHRHGDFLCDLAAAATGGAHPALAVKHDGQILPLADQQASNHRFMLQALLSSMVG